jgi:hypothetical protein
MHISSVIIQSRARLALIPAFSPGEKENRSPVSRNVVRQRWQEGSSSKEETDDAIPSLEGRASGCTALEFSLLCLCL